jgi:hypothetical protein
VGFCIFGRPILAGFFMGETKLDNQHKKITGYRDLSEQEIALMNEGKALAEQVGAFCDKLNFLSLPAGESKVEIDPRWLAIGKTDLQKGFMSLIRSIARPQSF